MLLCFVFHLVSDPDLQLELCMLACQGPVQVRMHKAKAWGVEHMDVAVQVIVQARKPEFVNNKMCLYEIVTEDGLMRPAMDACTDGSLYCGGGAAMVERALGLDGDEVLYVGDHIYTDAALAKLNFRSALLSTSAHPLDHQGEARV